MEKRACRSILGVQLLTCVEEVLPASSELYMVHRQADTTYAKGAKITSFLPQRKIVTNELK